MAANRKRVRVETARHVIEGVLQLPTEGYRSRTTDYLNAHDSDFVALTDATVRPLDSGNATEHEFIAVNLRHAVLVVELESLGVTTEPAGPFVNAAAPVAAVQPVAAEPPLQPPRPLEPLEPAEPPASSPPPGAA